jgi:hypothetical protein
MSDFEITERPTAELKEGPYQHPPFGEELRASIRQIQATFLDVSLQTVDEWENGFRRDVHHKFEVALWLAMARTYTHFTAGQNLDLQQKKDVFRVLVDASLGLDQPIPP